MIVYTQTSVKCSPMMLSNKRKYMVERDYTLFFREMLLINLF